MCSWMAYERPMDDEQEKERKKTKLIGKGELVGFIREPRKEVSKPRERQ